MLLLRCLCCCLSFFVFNSCSVCLNICACYVFLKQEFCYYSLRSVFIVCLILGVEHTITLICCQCEAVAVTMARAQLWPATAQNPQLAFTFELLDWAKTLLYECQIAVKDFFVSAVTMACAQ